MNNSVERFSNRVDNYVKFRPDYPREVISFLRENCGLTPDFIVADIGCGPGISSKMFLENGNRVWGVEPNAAMREAALKYLAEFPWFLPHDGTSDSTTLKDASVDLVVAAQAFHWFEPNTTRQEFHRILKPGGHIVLIWNERQLDSTPFLVDYEALLVKYAYDYGNVRHENIAAEQLQDFFRQDYRAAEFPNAQSLGLEGLRGRMLSSSYMPNVGDRVYEQLTGELAELFAKHAENGKIEVFYDTRVYYAKV